MPWAWWSQWPPGQEGVPRAGGLLRCLHSCTPRVPWLRPDASGHSPRLPPMPPQEGAKGHGEESGPGACDPLVGPSTGRPAGRAAGPAYLYEGDDGGAEEHKGSVERGPQQEGEGQPAELSEPVDVCGCQGPHAVGSWGTVSQGLCSGLWGTELASRGQHTAPPQTRSPTQSRSPAHSRARQGPSCESAGFQ